jgi:hypothetical protein
MIPAEIREAWRNIAKTAVITTHAKIIIIIIIIMEIARITHIKVATPIIFSGTIRAEICKM